jgi:uncharacterized protein (DUF885 family)
MRCTPRAPLGALLALGLASACASDEAQKRPPAPAKTHAPAVDDGPQAAAEAARLVSLSAERWWEKLMARHPEWATSTGDHRFNDRLGPMGPQARREWTQQLEVFVASLEEGASELDETSLSPTDGLTLALLQREVRSTLERARLGFATFDVDQMSGPQASLPYFFAEEVPMSTGADVTNLIARYRALTPWMEGHLDDLREGMALGRTAPRVVVQRVIGQLKEVLRHEKAPERSSFGAVRARIPAGLEAEERRVLEEDLLAATRESVLPAFRAYLEFLEKEYLPRAREQPGLGAMPGGKEAYAWLAGHYTTTELSPEEIHALGLKELARIEGEVARLAKERGHDGDVQSFLAALRKEKAQYAPSREALLESFKTALARADKKLPDAFGRLPKLPYEVKPMDAAREKDAPAAYYQPGAASDGRPGIFVANLHRHEERPLFNSEVLAFHEAVPGHHLQIALAQELSGLPKFRTEGGFTAFVEGWGLYSERLADELGLYTSLEARVGYLGFSAWRASRLVVDTGLHHMGWSRQQAVDFLGAHTTLGPVDVANEIDRYIAMPGQALAYMVGALRILELREHARAELGSRFDLRDFHDALLSAGALPLDVLDRYVSAQLGISPPVR